MSTQSNYTKPEDFRVHGLETIQPAYSQFEGKMYAGMLPSDNGDRTGMTMFWMFQPDTQEVPDSIVLWLNGGPGCSSFNCGVMMVRFTKSVLLFFVMAPVSFFGQLLMQNFVIVFIQAHAPVTQPLHDAGYCCLKPTPELHFNSHAWTRGTTM